MNNTPLISLIIPCYNAEFSLEKCLKSVIEQDYPTLEIIIIDDGSTDKFTLDLLETLKFDNKIKLISTINQGVCKARNQGFMESAGLFLLALDSDDLISPQFIELSVNQLLEDDSVKLVATNYNFFGRINRTVKLEEYSIEKLMGHNLFVVSTMFRRKDFDSVGGFNSNMKEGLEDWDFWLSIMKNGGDVKYIEGVNFFYRIKPKIKSRNISSAVKNHEILRRRLWQNHKELYSLNYPNPLEMQEYLNVVNSREYWLGKIILFPLRKFLNLF